MLIYAFAYAFIALVYRTMLDCEQKRQFEAFAKYCEKNSQVIPLTFVMGFYVSLVIYRWWALMTFPCTDRACYFIGMCIPSDDPKATRYRRAVARYLNLAQLLVFRDVSTSVKTRFPKLEDVVEAGFMTNEELKVFKTEKGENQLEKHNKYWLAVQWALNVFCRAYDANLIRDTTAFTVGFDQLVGFRDSLGDLLDYD